MNSSSNSQLSTFTSSENKGLLWSVLHGGGRFNSLPDASLKKVQVMFETTLNEMNESFQKTNQSIDLNVMNKEAVYAICKKLDKLVAEESKKSTTDQKKQQQIPQLETVYRAEDIQKERQSAFNMELKKKEEEMSSIIKLRKPDEIKFSDDVYDKPIGDDMERLLAETLASRERELEQLNNTTGKEDKNVAEKWINPNKESTPNLNSNYVNDSIEKKKKVSFNVRTEPEDEQPILSTMTMTVSESESESTETALELNTLMNKFKKINTNKNIIQNGQNVNNGNNGNLIIQMSEDITFIKNSLIELSEKIKNMSS
jgi:hypothetical protein